MVANSAVKKYFKTVTKEEIINAQELTGFYT